MMLLRRRRRLIIARSLQPPFRMNGKGTQQDSKRLAHLYLHPKIADTVTVPGGPPSMEIVLADVYNEALREAFYRDELIPDAKVIASTVMAKALKGLERNPSFLCEEKGRRKWARLSAEHLVLDRAKAALAEELREPRVANEMEFNARAGEEEERASRKLDFQTARERANASLSDTQRDILDLFLEDYTPIEIAEELEMSPATVRKELYRISEKLRVALTGTNAAMPRITS
jgi:RNA polymerase sigma factor (sigma-70 family)